MLLYSWSKVLARAETMTDIIIIMNALVWPSALYSKNDAKLRRLASYDYSGHCFLLNPKSLLEDRKVSKEQVIQYLALSSKRNFANFLFTGDKTLDCRLAKNLPTDNALITINNNLISFAYE